MSALAETVPSTLLVSWRKVRQLLPVYTAIATFNGFNPPPCADPSELGSDDGEGVLQIAAWIEEIDAVSQAQHLRTVLQDFDICSSDLCVKTWLQHLLAKPYRKPADRDKIDFLLAHYLRVNLPPSLQEGKPNYSAMKAVLEPVLGCCEGELPEETREVVELIGIAERCRTLAEFEQSGIIRRGRELKLRAGDLYFTAPFLLSFTHFNAVVRRECTRLMNSDLKFIGDALDRLDQQGITHIDCTAANWSDHEPIGELKSKWATWELVEDDYSKDFFANLIAFRSAVEEALARSIELSMTSVSRELKSIHSLLLEMRCQIDELPRKFASVDVKSAKEASAAPIAPKPVVVAQAATNAAQPATPEQATALPRPVKPELPVGPSVAAKPEASKPTPSNAPAVAPEATRPVNPRPKSESEISRPAAAVPAAKQESSAGPEKPAPAAVFVTPPATGPEPAEKAPNSSVIVEKSDRVSQVKPSAPPAAPIAPAKIPPPASVPAVKKIVAPDATPATPKAEVVTPAAAATTAAIDLEAGIARLQKTLSGKRPSAVSIAVAGTRILLTGAEASMFSVPNDRFAHAVQRAVMMRICLVSALETHSKTREKSTIAALVPVARGEHATLRELVNESKASKLAREEEILSATAKQLCAMLERAERAAR